jgi:hypothetical protein
VAAIIDQRAHHGKRGTAYFGSIVSVDPERLVL